MTDRAATHWDEVYGTRAADGLSWFQGTPDTSLRLVTRAAGPAAPAAAVIDVGAGASSLVDRLLDRGFADVTVLDVSAEALAVTRGRLVDRSPAPSFVVTDLLAWEPARHYDVWHDRAVFHFLVNGIDRQRYVETAARAITPGGALVVGTFAADGPTRCSGLPAAGYDAAALAAQFTGEFAGAFELMHTEREEHLTPDGTVQPFTWAVLRRS